MESISNFRSKAQFFILFKAKEGRAKGGRTKSKIYIMEFGNVSFTPCVKVTVSHYH